MLNKNISQSRRTCEEKFPGGPKTGREMLLADHDFIGPDQAEHIPRLLVKQIEVEVIITETLGQVLHPRHLGLKAGKLFRKNGFFRLDFDAAEQAIIALHGSKGKDRGKRQRHPEKQERTNRGTVLLCCHVCLIRAVLRRLTQV